MDSHHTPLRLLSILALLVGSVLFGLACQTRVSTRSVVGIDPARAQTMVQRDPGRYLILDTRPPEAFNAGRLPGARLTSLTEINPDRPDPAWSRYSGIIVYGQDPGSAVAEAVTKRLLSAGYSRVFLLDGGYAAWVASGRSVEK